VGVVLSVEAVPKKSDLKKCLIDVIGDGSSDGVIVVTNAKHIAEGWRVVVALENAVVPAGADPDEDSDVIVIKKTSVVR
jgi:tRNA-binding EMAP/Myf-like protein